MLLARDNCSMILELLAGDSALTTTTPPRARCDRHPLAHRAPHLQR